MGLSAPVIRYVKGFLGRYPNVGDVLRVIHKFVPNLEQKVFSKIYISNNGLLHVRTTNTKFNFLSIFNFCSKYVGFRIGALNNNGLGKAMTSEEVCMMLRHTGNDPQTVFHDVVKSELASNRELRSQVVASITEDVAKTYDKKVKENVNYFLTSDEMARLKMSFPDIDINFTNKKLQPHAFAAAHRDLETAFILEYLHYRSTKYFPSEYQFFIKDYGGNWFSHVARKRDNIHSCCPILSANDACGESKRLINV